MANMSDSLLYAKTIIVTKIQFTAKLKGKKALWFINLLETLDIKYTKMSMAENSNNHRNIEQ